MRFDGINLILLSDEDGQRTGETNQLLHPSPNSGRRGSDAGNQPQLHRGSGK